MKNFLKYAISFLLAFGLIYWVYKDQDLNQLWNETMTMNFGFISLSFFSALVAHWMRGLRWVLLAENIGFKVNSFRSFHAVMLGYVVNLVVPRGGEIARCGYIQNTVKIPFTTALGTVVMERLVDLLVMGLFVLLSFSLEFEKVYGFIQENKSDDNGGSVLIFSIAGAGLVVVLIVLWLLRNKLLKLNFVKNLIEGFTSVLKQKRPVLFIIYSFGIWFFYYLMMFFALKAFPATEHLSASIALAILMISTLGMIVPVPGGTGAYHYLVTKGLVLYGIAETSSTTFAAVSHALQLFEIIVLFLLCSLYVQLFVKKVD